MKLAARIVRSSLPVVVVSLLAGEACAAEPPVASKVAGRGQHAVLFVGDSHSVGTFGQTLTSLLVKSLPQASVTTVASCGSSPGWWLKGTPTSCGFWRHDANGTEESALKAATPKLDELIAAVKPKTIIVGLGSNLVPLSADRRRAETEAMMADVARKADNCIWIGPPDARKFSREEINAVYVLLRELASNHGCALLDSRSYTQYPDKGGDGLHYSGSQGTSIAKAWAYKLFSKEIAYLL
jgi:hypothetical protein